MNVRRVVTGHKADGKATIVIDEEAPARMSFRPGATVWNIWSTPLPGDNNDAADGAKRIVGTAMKNMAVWGTIHNWVNRGDNPCFIAFVLIDAALVHALGKKLEATG